MINPTIKRALPQTPSRIERVAVSGAAGFIGRHLCSHLARRGCEVGGLVQKGLPPASARGTSVAADVCEPKAWERVVHGASAVVHLAARVHYVDRRDATDVYMRTNAEGTRVAAEAAAAAGVGTFVLVSTVAIFDDALTDIAEETTPAPVSAYGRSKLAAEQLALEVAARSGLRVIVLRPPMVYGPGMKGNPLRLFAFINSGWPLPLASIRNCRSFLYVRNLTAAIDFVLQSESLKSGTYLVADRDRTSTPDLIRTVARELERSPFLVPFPIGVMLSAGRLLASASAFKLDPFTSLNRLSKSMVLHPRRLCDAGFEPPFSLAQGLAETAQWYRAAAKPH